MIYTFFVNLSSFSNNNIATKYINICHVWLLLFYREIMFKYSISSLVLDGATWKHHAGRVEGMSTG